MQTKTSSKVMVLPKTASTNMDITSLNKTHSQYPDQVYQMILDNDANLNETFRQLFTKIDKSFDEILRV